MKLSELALPGVYAADPFSAEDGRGLFAKPFEKDAFAALGLATDFAEEYYSVSKKGVVRGLHFQEPPAECSKLVYCLRGSVLDAVLDIRRKSPFFGRHITLELSAENRKVLYLPPGLAHGFCALSDDALLLYKVTAAYSREHDMGILWNSCGINWPVETAILSERDASFPKLADYQSPF